MVTLDVVRASNAKLGSLGPGLVALFVGATSGIGESTLKQFYRHANKPRVYFVGRNQDAADRILSELKAIKPDAEASFIKKDLSLLKNVDEVCDEIKAKEKKLNLLFMSSGTGSFKGRDETSEGLDRKLVTNYYARLRFTQQLLPLLQSASPHLSRVVSVLEGGGESASINLDDLGLKQSYSVKNAAKHAITMTGLAFEELAKENSTVSFVHAYPGIVKTNWGRDLGSLVKGASQVAFVLMRPWMVEIGESGERHLYVSTSNAYPAKSGDEEGVDVGTGKVKNGSAGEMGSGAYLVGEDGERRANDEALKDLRNKKAGPKIWEHLMKTFEAIGA